MQIGDDFNQDGFSSEQQLKHQDIVMDEPLNEILQTAVQHEQVKFKIPPPQQIKAKNYSLKPDIATGWNAPKVILPTPIPLTFCNQIFDELIAKVLKNDESKAKICYLGPRYTNSFASWYEKSFKFPYDHIKNNNIKFTDRLFCGQHWETENSVNFNSFFQSGNLDCAIQIGQRQYQLYIRVDSNTRGHLQWYNFKMKNLHRLSKYKFHICNFQKDKSLYTRGMKPYIFSQKKNKEENFGWQQSGSNVKYQKKKTTTCKIYNFDMKSMYRLTFQYSTIYEQDQVQVAYCIPYTYTRLQYFLKKQSLLLKKHNFFKISKLCTSLGGLQVPLIIIDEKNDLTQKIQSISTNKKKQKQQDNILQNDNKLCVIISCRAHPGQSNGSFMMEGFLEFLCTNSKMASFLRKNIIFKIVPMLNPDGVAIGNYRTGFSGRDFNREYRDPDPNFFPEVYAFKKLISQNKTIFKDRLLMFLDFHGHSTKKNTFMYGPQFPIIEKYYYESRIFPKILGNCTNMFRYYSCNFKISGYKATTARAIVLRKLNIQLSYTIETSNGHYYDYQKLKDIPYNDHKWKEMGIKTGQALYQYSSIIISATFARKQKLNQHRGKLSSTQQCINSCRGNRKTRQSKKKYIQSDNMIDNTIFQNNSSMLKLLQEIKDVQNNKFINLVSDDEMSQGESEKEDDNDDLSYEQMNFLKKKIRQKKQRKKIKINNLKETKKNSAVNIQQLLNNSENQIRTVPQNNILNNSELLQNEEIKKRQNRRSLIYKNKQSNFDDNDNKKIPLVTGRVINLSFGTYSPKRLKIQSEDRNKILFPSKLNFMQLMQIQQKKQKTSDIYKMLIKDNNKNNDLSYDILKRTCYPINNRWKQLQKNNQQFKLTQQQPLENINNNNKNINYKKLQKFQNYKYKRVIAQDYNYL